MKLSGVIKLVANILIYLSGGLPEGVLSRDHVVDGALDLTTALALKLGFYSIPATAVLVAAPLASSGGGITTVAGGSGRGTCATGIA
jgi:hypothetical protein